MLLTLASDPQQFLIVAIAFIAAIVLHEASHALAATWLGDDLPRLQGRVTLNPLKHLDPLGTIMIVIAPFGWGRPVLVNPYRLRYGPNRGMALVAAAGPASNVALALVLAPLVRALGADAGPDTLWLALALAQIVALNVYLAVFNMLPLPPLDGFSVLVGIVSPDNAARLNTLRSYGPGFLIGLFLLISFFPSLRGIIIFPANLAVSLLLGS